MLKIIVDEDELLGEKSGPSYRFQCSHVSLNLDALEKIVIVNSADAVVDRSLSRLGRVIPVARCRHLARGKGEKKGRRKSSILL